MNCFSRRSACSAATTRRPRPAPRKSSTHDAVDQAQAGRSRGAPAEVSLFLSEPSVVADNARYRSLSKEYAQLEPVARSLGIYDEAGSALQAARGMLARPIPSSRK